MAYHAFHDLPALSSWNSFNTVPFADFLATPQTYQACSAFTYVICICCSFCLECFIRYSHGFISQPPTLYSNILSVSPSQATISKITTKLTHFSSKFSYLLYFSPLHLLPSNILYILRAYLVFYLLPLTRMWAPWGDMRTNQDLELRGHKMDIC